MIRAMPHKLLIDTNVWLSNFDASRPHSDEARLLLDYAIRHGMALLYAPVSTKDVYYLVAASLKARERAAVGTVSELAAAAINEIAWGCLDDMTALGTAIGVDESDIWVARKLRAVHPDYEDDLVLAACERAGVDYLVSFDEKLCRDAPFPALTPAKMLDLLKSFE